MVRGARDLELRAAADLLGHSPGVLMKTYAHVMPDTTRAVADESTCGPPASANGVAQFAYSPALARASVEVGTARRNATLKQRQAPSFQRFRVNVRM
jgi:hypothetical protein